MCFLIRIRIDTTIIDNNLSLSQNLPEVLKSGNMNDPKPRDVTYDDVGV